MTSKKKILVAPLNWGLGHASRCIPIINYLVQANYEPILASDGEALILLRKEFPHLTFYELPSYRIKYSKTNKQKLRLLIKIPGIIKAIQKEKQAVAHIVVREKMTGIISDNRFGVYHSTIPSVYITHQINVLSGITTSISSKLHQLFIANFDEVWVPDSADENNLSGKLSEFDQKNLKVRFIGALSRFARSASSIKKYDLLVLLSGPEPQRSILEKTVLKQLSDYNKRVLLVRGVFNGENLNSANENITVVNYMLSNELERALHESALVLARSGYSTVMDMAKLQKQAFFIPTPGQYEQEYLAKRMKHLDIAPYAAQDQFNINLLSDVNKYSGFAFKENDFTFKKELFHLFESN